jgi:hypothetical protein
MRGNADRDATGANSSPPELFSPVHSVDETAAILAGGCRIVKLAAAGALPLASILTS